MKHENIKGKIYVSSNAYLGVLKHFVEDFVEDDELQSVEEFILFLRQFFPHTPSEC